MANTRAGDTRYAAGIPANTLTYDDSTKELVRWVKEELDKISVAISSLEYQYSPLYAEPERYSVGFIAYADGVNWNPGSGEGLYIYKSTGWTLLG